MSVYNLANWRGDTTFLVVALALLLPATTMLVVTSRARMTPHFTNSPT
jgi:hypothetical protein